MMQWTAESTLKPYRAKKFCSRKKMNQKLDPYNNMAKGTSIYMSRAMYGGLLSLMPKACQEYKILSQLSECLIA